MDLSLVFFLGVNFLAAMGGGLFRPGPDYERLNFPSWRPPNFLFAPVWLVLFVMIAVSGWLVWLETKGEGAGFWALALYLVHLVVNFLWSAFFFGLKRRDLALVNISVLWASIVLMILVFHPIRPLAAYLLAPYLFWVSFAAFLNFTMWRLNRDDGGALQQG